MLQWITAWYQLFSMFSMKKCFKQSPSMFFMCFLFFYGFRISQMDTWLKSNRFAKREEESCCLQFSAPWTRPSLTEACVLEMKTRNHSLLFARVLVVVLSAFATYNHGPSPHPVLCILFSSTNFIISFNLSINLFSATLSVPTSASHPLILSLSLLCIFHCSDKIKRTATAADLVMSSSLIKFVLVAA